MLLSRRAHPSFSGSKIMMGCRVTYDRSTCPGSVIVDVPDRLGRLLQKEGWSEHVVAAPTAPAPLNIDAPDPSLMSARAVKAMLREDVSVADVEFMFAVEGEGKRRASVLTALEAWLLARA